MYKYLDNVRRGLSGLVSSLVTMATKHHARLRLGVIAHGDYCDKNSSYVIKYLPLMDMEDKGCFDRILAFLSGVGPTSGGDGPECYELALHKALTEMGWGKGSTRTLVMVGDATPHEPGYRCGDYVNTLDWRVCLEGLAKRRVRIYAVQAGDWGGKSTAFWGRLADDTRGKRLAVTDIGTLKNVIAAAVCKELGEGAFAELGAEISSRGEMCGEFAVVFETIRTVASISVAAPAAAMASLRLTEGGAGGRHAPFGHFEHLLSARGPRPAAAACSPRAPRPSSRPSFCTHDA
jgi:hypothetical protein